MGREVGFNFSVGARMARSVGSVFDTVATRAGKLKTDLKQLRALSSVSGKITSTGSRVARLKAEAAAGKDVSAQLEAANRAFASAQRSGQKYGVTMSNAAKYQARATAEIKRTEAALARQDTRLRNQARRGELKGELFGTLAAVGMAAAPVRMAVNFESAMADAAKTIEGMRDDVGNLTPAYYEMETAVKRMGRSLPLTHEELAALFAAGGQMGYQTAEELEEFATMAAHMGVAFNMGNEEAAAAIGGYRTALGLSFGDTREMLDLMNQFANTSSATEASIADIVRRVGALGDMAGVSHKPMTALAATMASMKIKDDIAATGIKNMLLSLTIAPNNKRKGEALQGLGIDPGKLAKQMQTDAEGAIIAVMERIQKLPDHMKPQVMEQLFGKESLGAIAPLLSQLDLLKKNLGIAADTSAYAGAMQKEFENRARTTANALTITKNRAAEFGISLGASMLPAINEVLASLGNGASSLADFANANPQAMRAVMMTATALAGLKAASLGVRFALTGLSDAWLVMRGVWSVAQVMCKRATYAMLWQRGVAVASAAASKIMAIGQGMVTAAQWAMNAAMTANPLGIVIAGVTALGAVLYGLYQTCEPVRQVVDWMWEGLKAGVQGLFDLLGAAWDKLSLVWKGIKKVASWFSDDESGEEDDLGVNPVIEPLSPASGGAVPVPAPPPMPRQPEIMNSRAMAERLAEAEATASAQTVKAGSPALATPYSAGGLRVTQEITVNAQIKELRKEVLDALKGSGRELETILGNLLRDRARVSYGS